MSPTPAGPTGPLLDPASFASGFGVPEGCKGVITSARYAWNDYNNTRDPVVCLQLIVTAENGGEHSENLSVGDAVAENYHPSEDGRDLELNDDGQARAFGRNSKLGIFFESLVNAGFPQDRLQTSATSAIEGAALRFDRQPSAPTSRRSGLFKDAQRGEGDQPPQRDRTDLVVAELIALPGEKAAAKAAGAKTSGGAKRTTAAQKANAGAASPGAGTGADVDEERDMRLTGIVADIVGKADAPLTRRALSTKVMIATKGKDEETGEMFEAAFAKYAIKRAFDPEFLTQGAADGVWAFDGENAVSAS